LIPWNCYQDHIVNIVSGIFWRKKYFLSVISLRKYSL
jgi:hypothetical protein